MAFLSQHYRTKAVRPFNRVIKADGTATWVPGLLERLRSTFFVGFKRPARIRSGGSSKKIGIKVHSQIEKMVKDAEMHESEDKKRRELIEAKNQADSLVYTTEKSLKDNEDKIDAETKSNIESALEDVKKAMEGDDVEAINKAVEALSQASHKLAEAMYAEAQQEGEAGEGAEQGEAAGEDDVVDAEYEDVEDDKKK